MPIKDCSIEGNPGYKWGDTGKCYPYNPNDDLSKKEARQRAAAQGIAIGDIEANKKFSLDFLKESDIEIIRNINDPEMFIDDSFEAMQIGIALTVIAGRPKDQNLIQGMLNPEQLVIQSVKFKKPDWTLDTALQWLKENMKYFDQKNCIKKYAKKDLKSINGVEIFSAGTWNGDTYSVQDLDIMVKAFEETQETVRPFIKLGHSDKQKILEAEGLPAAGWIGRVYRQGDKLLADFVDIPRKIYEIIENKAYRKVSSEIYLGVKIKEKAYKYMLGAVALLGAETPGVMNLSDILARFGLKDYDSIKSYAQNENDVKLVSYSIENEININKQGDPMPKTEKEIALELQLKEAKEKLNAATEDAKKYKTDLETKETALKEEKQAKIEAEKKAFEMEKKAHDTEIEKQADALVASKLISKSMRPYAVALLRNEQDPETKKYSFKDGDKEKELDRFELIKTYTDLAKKASEVNFEDNSEEGNKEAKEDDVKQVEKYAKENDLSFADAYRAFHAGKMQIEKPHVQEN